MANLFDKFDEPGSGNLFDQFDETEDASAPEINMFDQFDTDEDETAEPIAADNNSDPFWLINQYHEDTVAQGKSRTNEDATTTTVLSQGVLLDGKIYELPGFDRDTGKDISQEEALKKYKPLIDSGELPGIPLKTEADKKKYEQLIQENHKKIEKPQDGEVTEPISMAKEYEGRTDQDKTNDQMKTATEDFFGKIEGGPSKAAIDHLEKREGNKDYSYFDSRGKLSGGIGHLLTAEEKKLYPKGSSIPKDVRDKWLAEDTAKAWAAAQDQAQQIGRPDMVDGLFAVNYQLGTSWNKDVKQPDGSIKKGHKKTWKYLMDGDIESAIPEAADSLWNTQTPKRVKDFQDAMRASNNPEEKARQIAAKQEESWFPSFTSGSKEDWMDAGVKMITNLPDIAKSIVGGLIRDAGEGTHAEMGNILAEKGIYMPPEDLPGVAAAAEAEGMDPDEYLKWDADRASESGLALYGADMYQKASSALEGNQPIAAEGSLPYYAYHIASSTAQMVPALGASIFTKNPNVGLSIIGSQVWGQKYAEERAKGTDIELAKLGAFVYTASEVLTEKIPLGILTKEGGSGLARILKAGGAEALQEPINQAIQMAYDIGIDKDATFSEALQNPKVWRTFADAAIIGYGAGTSLAAGANLLHPGKNKQLGQMLNNVVDNSEFTGSAEAAARERLYPGNAQIEKVAPIDPVETATLAINKVMSAPDLDSAIEVGVADLQESLAKYSANSEMGEPTVVDNIDVTTVPTASPAEREAAFDAAESVPKPEVPTPENIFDKLEAEMEAENKASIDAAEERVDVDKAEQKNPIGYLAKKLEGKSDTMRAKILEERNPPANTAMADALAKAGIDTKASKAQDDINAKIKEDSDEFFDETDTQAEDLTTEQVDDTAADLSTDDGMLNQLLDEFKLDGVDGRAGSEGVGAEKKTRDFEPSEPKPPIAKDESPEAYLGDKYGFKTDVPAASWLEEKQEDAEADIQSADSKGNKYTSMGRGLNTSTTGYFPSGTNLQLPVSEISNLEGVMGEHRTRDTGDKLKPILKDMGENGYDQESPISIHVNHRGEAFVSEGNHRLAAAKQLGIDKIPVEIRYFAGGELADGAFSPSKLSGMLSQVAPTRPMSVTEKLESQVVEDLDGEEMQAATRPPQDKEKVELKDIMISEDIIDENGDVHMVKRSADVIIKEADESIDSLKLLQSCINA